SPDTPSGQSADYGYRGSTSFGPSDALAWVFLCGPAPRIPFARFRARIVRHAVDCTTSPDSGQSTLNRTRLNMLILVCDDYQIHAANIVRFCVDRAYAIHH